MKVTNEIEIYEINGSDYKDPKRDKKLIVNSHWLKDEWIKLTFQEQTITVKASELQKAIQNSINWKSLI